MDQEKQPEIEMHAVRSLTRRKSRRHLLSLALLASTIIVAVLLLFGQSNSHKAVPAVPLGTAFDPIGGGVKLRIMALGDSITAGTVSADGIESASSRSNGYRLFLRNSIMETGVQDADIDFIGSRVPPKDDQATLAMPDNQNEGWPNEKINKILAHVMKNRRLLDRPNLVLIHAGTNDMNDSPENAPWTQAHLRLGAMVDEVLCQVPEAVVIISKIIRNDWQQARTDEYNAKLPQVVADRRKAGYKVLLADHSAITPGPDKTHPSDAGYKQMAANWMETLDTIPAGWIQEPQAAVKTANICHSTEGSPFNWHEEFEQSLHS
ncbi:carbohydrate esterase family 3 protein [Pseudocercospora fijiensis CIRAD86]|uniref:Carbohydrate esterase family 3 protein n=1 Tax=Pseudocercospora fijiensis (strain CIRAD86) TaxID=383855 RepID=M3AQR8_PSEFD|nr:carbohydrate esterase family 3 protein [Pseudocercospora fijiensis CIRAD86]EME79443.1 carbohydrate esterase family 3 protein [Pseudocercospora fijiensis CIRAD86]